MPSRLGTFLLILLIATQACNVPLPGGPPTPTVASPQPTPSETPAPATSTPRIEPTPTAGSPAATPDPHCRLEDKSAVLAPVDFAGYPQAVLDFINAGGTLQDLDAALYAAGVANQPVAVASGDLTGDGVQDVIVSIYDPGSLVIPPEGVLLVYTCHAGQYGLAHRQISEEGFGAPGIRYLQDLTNDGVDELVVSSAICGAHTCFEDAQVLAWDGEGFVDKLEGSTSDLPYPDVRIEDPDGDGIFDIVVVGSGFGSVGAGPQRNLMRRWSLLRETQGWQLLEDTLGPSNYRVHVLHDAEKAALEGDFDLALLLYGRVAQDTTLEEWTDPETERANLGAYALFKTAVVYLLQGREEFAESTFEQQRVTYPPGEIGYAFVELAAAFQKAYAEGGIPSGCAAARQFAEVQTEQVLQPLGLDTYGYANPEYTPENICPW
ncbi:MAG TPA: VCBS repeat-containing protein [Anaerolineales bacterium]|nr:VCBS repeat-containing protein [Anaerolineales bacterium]